VTDLYGVDAVSRMALIPHASDASRYERFTGLEPELHTQAAAWLVEFAGGVFMPIEGATWYDTVCVDIGGSAGFYGTGATLFKGRLYAPPSVAAEPEFALPTLAP
jgi:hypothetical protein